jgi:hypothetical protein
MSLVLGLFRDWFTSFVNGTFSRGVNDILESQIQVSPFLSWRAYPLQVRGTCHERFSFFQAVVLYKTNLTTYQ